MRFLVTQQKRLLYIKPNETLQYYYDINALNFQTIWLYVLIIVIGTILRFRKGYGDVLYKNSCLRASSENF